MPTYCDVAVPVPLDAVFTYKVGDALPVVGGRVLVPFRTGREVGIVTAIHDKPPRQTAKIVIEALDVDPVLDRGLLELGQWIAQYYIAPVGEVFRSMLPLAAEVKRQIVYRITETGYKILADSAEIGSSLRSKLTDDEQAREYAALDHLSQRESASEGS